MKRDLPRTLNSLTGHVELNINCTNSSKLIVQAQLHLCRTRYGKDFPCARRFDMYITHVNIFSTTLFVRYLCHGRFIKQ